MHKMCIDELKCAVMKGYLCSDKKVIRKFGWINRILWVKMVVRKSESSFCDRNMQWWIFLKTCSDNDRAEEIGTKLDLKKAHYRIIILGL